MIKNVPSHNLIRLVGFASASILVFHAVAFFFYIGPFNLYTDSLGYLLTADNLFTHGQFSWNQNRPIGLPMLYYILLAIAQKQIAAIVFFQIVVFYLSVYWSIKALFPERSVAIRLLVMLGIVALSLRTFLYSYMVLSESLFSSAIIIACAMAISYATNASPESKRTRLKYFFFFSLSAALIKSIGILFLAASLLLYAFHYVVVERRKLLWLPVLISLPIVVALNYSTLGVASFSKQDGIQLLISANKYINYSSSFMAEEKGLIRDSHHEILNRFYPRTRLDQMIGPIEGIETPAQLLEKSSQTYDEYNSKIRSLVIEGLMSGHNLILYLLDGGAELYKLIVENVSEGLIIPTQIGNVNHDVLNSLPSVKDQNDPEQYLSKAFKTYYSNNIRLLLIPKYVPLAVFFLAFICYLIFARGKRKQARTAWSIAFVALLCLGDLYLSSLLVFALDRYYAGIEVLLWLLSFVLVARLWDILSSYASSRFRGQCTRAQAGEI